MTKTAITFTILAFVLALGTYATYSATDGNQTLYSIFGLVTIGCFAIAIILWLAILAREMF